MNRRTFLQAGLATLAMPALVAAQSQRVLRFIPQADLAVLDPMWTTAFVTRHHGYMVFDTLFGMDAELRPVPQMAEGVTQENGGRVWKITLRDGLRFHDGEPVRARDCVASLKRWGRRDGFGQSLFAVTDELVAQDDKTIVFRLKEPYPKLLEALGKPQGFMPAIMPERLAETDAFTQVSEMVGSGPYRFKADERVPGARVVYERNAEYRPREGGGSGWTAGPKIVHFDRVEWNVVPDSATASGALARGEADWWEYPLHDLLPQLRRNRNIRIEITDPSGMIPTFRMNTLTTPFNNAAVRRALFGAVNQADYMAAQVGNEPSLMRTGVGFFCPGTPLANDAGMEALNGRRDINAVKRALREAGYNGEKVVLMVGTDVPNVKNACDVAADMMQQCGMTVDYQTTDWGTVVQRRASRNPIDQGGWSAYCSSWGGLDHLNPAVHLLLRGDGSFFGWPRSEEIERLRAQWFDTPDLPAQQEIARKIQQQAFIDAPYLPLGQYIQPTAYRSNLTDMQKGFATFWGLRRA
jgi:peptide/nickel transport system substrate-binding protein